MTGMKFLAGSSRPSLEKQKDDSNSMYNHYKNLLHIRKNTQALNNGTYESFKVKSNDVMAYKRESDKETVYVFHNFSRNPVTLDVPEVSKGEIIFKSNDNDILDNGKVTIDKTSSLMIKIDK